MDTMLVLTKEEAKAVYEVINMLSGDNAGNAFAWDGTDSLDDVTTRAMAKLFLAAGRDVPKECEDA